MNHLRLEILEFGSLFQKQSIGLRYEVLRRPLNIGFDPADLEQEFNEIHIAAILGSEVAGCLLLKKIDDDTVKMRQVAVSEKYQGHGIGKKMVLFSEEIAKEKGFKKMELHARETAVPFYLQLNYGKIGERFEEVGIPHWKMEKNIQ